MEKTESTPHAIRDFRVIVSQRIVAFSIKMYGVKSAVDYSNLPLYFTVV